MKLTPSAFYCFRYFCDVEILRLFESGHVDTFTKPSPQNFIYFVVMNLGRSLILYMILINRTYIIYVVFFQEKRITGKC